MALSLPHGGGGPPRHAWWPAGYPWVPRALCCPTQWAYVPHQRGMAAALPTGASQRTTVSPIIGYGAGTVSHPGGGGLPAPFPAGRRA